MCTASMLGSTVCECSHERQGRVSHWSHSSSVELWLRCARVSVCLWAEGTITTQHCSVPIGSGRLCRKQCSHPRPWKRESRGDERVDTSEVATGQARREGARSVEPDAGIPPQRARKHTVTGGDCPTAQDTMGWLELRLVWLSTSKTSSQAQRWRRSSGRSARCV
jgi:hypothetical protein